MLDKVQEIVKKVEHAIMEEGAGLCYIVLPKCVNQQGEYVACMVVEGIPGYFRTTRSLGNDLSLALECADINNELIGISKEEAIEIVASSRRAAGLG